MTDDILSDEHETLEDPPRKDFRTLWKELGEQLEELVVEGEPFSIREEMREAERLVAELAWAKTGERVSWVAELLQVSRKRARAMLKRIREAGEQW